MKKSFEDEGSHISYNVVGEGRPVILLHGFGEDSTIWDEQVLALQKICKVIVPDIPGSGQSERLQKENVTIEDFAHWLDKLLIHENIVFGTLLGHSMGGYIILAYEEKYPDKLAGFGLIHSTAFADSDEKKENRKQGIKMMDEYGAFSFLKNTTPNLFAEKYKKEQKEKMQAFIEAGRPFTKEALIQYYGAMMHRPDRTNVLKDSKVPVLFVMGSEDVAAPKADLMKQVNLPEISHFHILENVGHMSMMENPAALNNILLRFVNESKSEL